MYESYTVITPAGIRLYASISTTAINGHKEYNLFIEEAYNARRVPILNTMHTTKRAAICSMRKYANDWRKY